MTESGQPSRTAAGADRERARVAFERGLAWFLTNADGISPDGRAAVLASVLLASPRRARQVRKHLRPRGLRARLAWRWRPNPLRTLSAILEKDPLPLAWSAGETFPAPTDPLPGDAASLQQLDGLSNLALFQISGRQLEDPALAWLRREDLWGYDLTHQIFAWVLCAKSRYLLPEARERACLLLGRLLHEIEGERPATFYDLDAERSAFAARAGAPADRLARWIPDLLAAQDGDGGWWFTRDRAEQAALLENAHLGASPIVLPAASYRDEPDPELARRGLEILHRGHATSLTLWALAFHLQAAPR